MILLQLSSGSGPAECCLAVAKASDRLRREAAAMAVDVAVVESEPGPEPGTWHSLLLSLSGEEAAPTAETRTRQPRPPIHRAGVRTERVNG